MAPLYLQLILRLLLATRARYITYTINKLVVAWLTPIFDTGVAPEWDCIYNRTHRWQYRGKGPPLKSYLCPFDTVIDLHVLFPSFSLSWLYSFGASLRAIYIRCSTLAVPAPLLLPLCTWDGNVAYSSFAVPTMSVTANKLVPWQLLR